MVGVLTAGGVGAIGLTIYSFAVWKNDPEKTAPAGTTLGEPRRKSSCVSRALS